MPRLTDTSPAAAEAARRAAAEAARRAAELAAAKAAALALQKKTAAAAVIEKRPAKLLRDELSTGRGTALRTRGLAASGGNLAAQQLASVAPSFSIADIMAAQRKGLAVVNPSPPAALGPPAPQLTTTEQATQDAVSVDRAYDSALSSGSNEAQAAKAASAELERLAAVHTGDAAYLNTLVRASAETIDKIATTLGSNTEGHYKDGDDKNAIKDTLKSLARVAEAGGAVTAGTLGRTLASKVDDDSELFQFDDAFYEFKNAGGTNLLFDATTSALRAAGKDDAAGELAERGGDGGFVDGVQDGFGDVIGAVADGFGAVAGFATDLGEGILSVATDVGEFAVDVAEGTVDLVGDAANWTKDQVGNAVQYAVEQGLRLAGPVVEKVRELAKEGIDNGLGITENIDSLEEGDSLSIGGDFHAQLGVAIDASAEIQVGLSRDENGNDVYTVSGEVSAGVGLGAGGTATAGVGGKMEFTFDNAEDAAKAAKILAAGAAGVAALASGPGAILAPALLPSPGDLSFLQDNLASVEVSASVGAQFASAGGAADASVEGTTGYKLNFEDGRPVSMTRVTSIEAEGSVGGPLELVKDSLGNALSIPGDATASGSVTVETTIPIDGSGFTDLVAFLASPASAAVIGEAETRITLEGDFTVAGNAGVHGEIQIDDIDASEVRSVVNRLLHGDPAHAFDGVEVEISGSGNTFHDRGFDWGFDGTVAGQGIEVNAHNEVREEDQATDFEVQIG